ncbi:MAG TPA: CRTAC1 family protein [Vicinamibacteria bacterium]|nr:CRTAC1 family protein [Vicinamibacteria bacterium]
MRLGLVLLGPALGLLPAADAPRPAADAVRFVDVTDAVGIDFRHVSSSTSQKYLPETMGSGVALLDYDGDGRLDIFFANGARIDDPMPAGGLPVKDGPRYWNRLYRQKPDGRFEDVTAAAGVAGTGYGQGVAVGDYDNDGDEDLYVAGVFANQLYRNEGDGRFTDVTAEAGVAGEGWSSSAAFVDLDHDGRLDLFVGRYMEWSFGYNPHCSAAYNPFPEQSPNGPRAYCHPNLFKGKGALLYRNEGGGRFRDVSKEAGVANPGGKSLGVAMADFDGDGLTDIFVANDAVQQFLYRNRGGGRFEDVAFEAFAAFDQDGKAFSGMGTDAADYDNDGRPDVVVTNLSNQCYALFRNLGDWTFSYETHASGLGRISLLSSGWGVRFLDYDNDGWKDLFLVQGHVLDTIELTSPHLRYRQPPLIARNEGGRFRDVSAGAGDVFKTEWAARGLAIGDIDDDGDLDIVVSTLDDRGRVLRNEGGNRGHWVQLRLVGRRSNRDGIGAEVRVTTASGAIRHATARTAGGYLSAGDRRVHLGLGAEKGVRSIEIRWPSGTLQRLNDVAVDQILTVTEPEADPARPKPGVPGTTGPAR